MSPKRKMGVKKKSTKCVACGGTGKNSKGGDCIPCQINRRKPAVKKSLISVIGNSVKRSKGFMPDPSILLHKNIPKPMHGMAPREILGAKWWKETKALARKKCQRRCEACGVHEDMARGGKRLEGHEFYEIDYEKGRMVYIKTVMICNYCHCYIHDGLLRVMVESGKVRASKLDEVLEHGDGILTAAGLEKETPMPSSKMAEWSRWRLVIGKKTYPPKFKSMRQWWAINRRLK